MSTWRRLVDGIRPVDVALAAVVFTIGLIDVLAVRTYDPGPRLLTAMTLQTVPLLWRRSNTGLLVSLSVLGVVLESGTREEFSSGYFSLIAFVIVVHAVSRWTSGTTRRLCTAMLLIAVLITLTAYLHDTGALIGNAVGTGVIGGAAWLVGQLGRRDAVREHESVVRTAAAIEEERTRISRDLHDVVGHALAGIALTAGAAERQPATTDQREALALIQSMSASAASDVRRLVGMLRDDTDAEGMTPQPTLERLPDLISWARAAGSPASLEVTGEPWPASGGLELTAYRVVQEAVTNAVRHASGAPIQIGVHWTPEHLELVVDNQAGQDTGPGSGHGIIGLTERVSMYAGTLVAGRTGSGWRLAARLPR